MTNIYDAAVKTMRPGDIDHHCSDLYLRVNDISRNLVNQYRFKSLVTTFVDQIDHVLWYDIPFAYTPDYIEYRNGGTVK